MKILARLRRHRLLLALALILLVVLACDGWLLTVFAPPSISLARSAHAILNVTRTPTRSTPAQMRARLQTIAYTSLPSGSQVIVPSLANEQRDGYLLLITFPRQQSAQVTHALVLRASRFILGTIYHELSPANVSLSMTEQDRGTLRVTGSGLVSLSAATAKTLDWAYLTDETAWARYDIATWTELSEEAA